MDGTGATQAFVRKPHQRQLIPLNECHTPGHATVQDLLRLRHAFPNAPVVPIHTVHADQFEKLFGNVQLRTDGEWWSVL
jgi:ribonuclease J